jgi:hypothetical protein
MTVIEKPSHIAVTNPPENVWDTCKTWNAYTTNHFVDQIDSGL